MGCCEHVLPLTKQKTNFLYVEEKNFLSTPFPYVLYQCRVYLNVECCDVRLSAAFLSRLRGRGQSPGPSLSGRQRHRNTAGCLSPVAAVRLQQQVRVARTETSQPTRSKPLPPGHSQKPIHRSRLPSPALAVNRDPGPGAVTLPPWNSWYLPCLRPHGAGPWAMWALHVLQ